MERSNVTFHKFKCVKCDTIVGWGGEEGSTVNDICHFSFALQKQECNQN
jgi:hypothetical protein